jgi:hypothetical protein
MGTAMTTEALIAFIRARIDEDERWALAASAPYPYAAGDPKVPAGGLHWEWVTGDNWDTVTPDPVLGEHVADGDPVWLASRERWPSSTRPDDPRWQMRRTYGEDIQEMDAAAAGHILRHDPARVLQGVNADRTLLDWAEAYWRDGKDTEGGPRLLAQAARQALECLGLRWVEHPDYRPEWRPSWT